MHSAVGISLLLAALVSGQPAHEQHAVNAAAAANQAEQSAVVAGRVAMHAELVARDTAAALRYTEDALRRAGASERDLAEVEATAQELEREAQGATPDEGEKDRLQKQVERLRQEYEAKSIDVDSQPVPFESGVEPFGVQESAEDLTEASVGASNGMVDQVEKAQKMEAKRAVFRALTRLRGVMIGAYDGMAKGHMLNVEKHAAEQGAWRKTHPVRHLAEEEADMNKWAFPPGAIAGPPAAAASAAVSPAAAFVAAPKWTGLFASSV